jgi:hypothetical protein
MLTSVGLIIEEINTSFVDSVSPATERVEKDVAAELVRIEVSNTRAPFL